MLPFSRHLGDGFFLAAKEWTHHVHAKNGINLPGFENCGTITYES